MIFKIGTVKEKNVTVPVHSCKISASAYNRVIVYDGMTFSELEMCLALNFH